MQFAAVFLLHKYQTPKSGISSNFSKSHRLRAITAQLLEKHGDKIYCTYQGLNLKNGKNTQHQHIVLTSLGNLFDFLASSITYDPRLLHSPPLCKAGFDQSQIAKLN
ncbi:hypothetical protein T4A_423 [Trichinella pseudospiralis]|uniref:Uncharacterized protein n=1 Tax=Trichinella pseudospiralis TaxID=6337 RepID=A0A0V1EDX9_TRIPS|nr:hypothetical protein T4A_423 [Trichinella pseudospiralis]